MSWGAEFPGPVRDIPGNPWNALGIRRNEFGAEHILVAETLSVLALCHGRLNDTPKKRDLLERVLIIQKSELGPHHRQVAATLENLANAHGKKINTVLAAVACGVSCIVA